MQSDMLGSVFCCGYSGVLDNRKTELFCAGHGRGNADSEGCYDKSGLGCDCGEVEDSGDGAGCANGDGAGCANGDGSICK